MKQEEVVNQLASSIEKRNWEQVEKNLADDFIFSGAVPNPIGKKEWLGVHRALAAGLPDLRLNLYQVKVSGNKVIAKVRLEGTHTALLPSPAATLPSVPATGKKVRLPEEDIEVTFKGDKISNFYVKPIPNGGLMGILDQVGAHVEEHH